MGCIASSDKSITDNLLKIAATLKSKFELKFFGIAIQKIFFV